MLVCFQVLREKSVAAKLSRRLLGSRAADHFEDAACGAVSAPHTGLRLRLFAPNTLGSTPSSSDTASYCPRSGAFRLLSVPDGRAQIIFKLNILALKK